MNDYIIMTDSSGRHYLSHGYAWRSHKYILKIGEGAKALYFYTQKEIQNYLNQNKKKEATESVATETEVKRPSGRVRNVTGTATAIKKGEKVSGGPVGPAGSAPNSGSNVIRGEIATAVRKAEKQTGNGHREIFYRDGQYYVVNRSKDKTSATFANNRNATLLGSKKERDDYRKAKEDVRLLKSELTKLRKKNQSEQGVASNIAIAEKALKRAENHLVIAKDNYDRTRTIDEIPDYIYTKGLEAINKYLKRRG